MTRLLPLSLVLVAIALPVSAQEQTCGAPTATNDGWTISAPANVGLDAEKLCGLDKFLGQWQQPDIHAVVVARHGKLVLDRYFTGFDQTWGIPAGQVTYTADMKHDLRSISKSTVSLLVGIAKAEGKFPDLDSPVIDQFPDYAELRTPTLAKVTFRHLLTMSSGFTWDETPPYSDPANSERRMIEASDPVRYVLQQPFSTAPGQTYNYDGGNTALLGATVARKTGKRLDDYAAEKLFAPLGIADFEWKAMPGSGQLAFASGLRLRARDTAKLGQLLLADGTWQGKRVLPAGWVKESTTPRINGEGLYFYGYQWWLGRTFFKGRDLQWIAGVGYGGQRLFVAPDLDLVVMVNAGLYASRLQGAIPLAIFKDLVLMAVKD
ncbi:CubicO group peptidase, beta-lactamase class C family [Enhydrobacter aerosaccus]|uniref:CubicO group peptidase, beta-lactamase class C family n=1 Tax=Enhydrobacter aerosaccus TaxID=225324 RepID=A0A1T4JVE4_9HYPH|nr:serine hydrolase [Enhydrobacter aerosaccus]SJZ34037.1 CubicO group peptidase, beta-lactamase class C family [Enhydrobacter aerosaccus]